MKKKFKKFILASSVMSLLTTVSLAQSQPKLAADPWLTTGNVSTGGSNILGFTDAASTTSILIKNKGTTRICVKPSGQIGVGTTSPDSKFHVSGSESSVHGKTAAIEVSNTASLGTNWYLRSGANGTATPPKGFSIADDNGYWLVIDSLSRVGLGTTSPAYKLDVQGRSNDINVVTYSKVNYVGNSDVVAVRGFSQPALGYGVGIDGVGGYISVRGVTSSPNSTDNTHGGFFSATGGGSGKRYGVYASASGSTDTSSGGNYAVYGSATGSNSFNAYGGYFTASGSGLGKRYGVFASGSGSSSAGSNYAFYSNGTSIVIGGTWSTSDARLKKEVQPLQNSLDKIMMLKPSSYQFKTEEYTFMNLPSEKQDGFLAQDLEKVFPEMVQEIQHPLTDDKGSPNGKYFSFKGVNYDKMIPVLVAALQEEHTLSERRASEMAQLKTKLNDLENALFQCCTSYQSGKNSSSANEQFTPASLEQNTPNPFTENTIIKYYIPSTSQNAFIKIISLDGKEMQTIKINQQGAGQITLVGNALSAGTYSYQLIIDGKAIDNKLMTLTK